LIVLAVLPAGAGELEFDKSADFSGYRTYAWKEGTEARRDDAQATITAAVEQELAGKGLTPVESDPDLYVATYVLVDAHSLEELSKPGQWEYWTGVSSVDAYQVGAGTLIIDLVDAETGGVVWRSLATGTVRGAAKKIRKRLPKMVRKMLLDYPPSGLSPAPGSGS
jgi:hypothetical protein